MILLLLFLILLLLLLLLASHLKIIHTEISKMKFFSSKSFVDVEELSFSSVHNISVNEKMSNKIKSLTLENMKKCLQELNSHLSDFFPNFYSDNNNNNKNSSNILNIKEIQIMKKTLDSAIERILDIAGIEVIIIIFLYYYYES